MTNGVAAIVRRVIAQPARSAVATAALGLIVGVASRTILVRHSTPNAAAGSANSTTTMQPLKPRSSALVAVKKPNAPHFPGSNAQTQLKAFRGEEIPDGWIFHEFDPILGNSIDGRGE
jgi:hypothetical protein